MGRCLFHLPRLSEHPALPAGPLGSRPAQGCRLCWKEAGLGSHLLWNPPAQPASPRGESIGSPTRGTPGTRSAGLSSFGTPQQFAGMCSIAPTARHRCRGEAGSPYRSRPPSGSGDTWACWRLGWARDSARTGSGMLHAGPAEVTARLPRPGPPSAAQMCAPPRPDVRPARSWRRAPGARPCAGSRDGVLHPFLHLPHPVPLHSLHLTAHSSSVPIPQPGPLCSPGRGWGGGPESRSERSCDWHRSIN